MTAVKPFVAVRKTALAAVFGVRGATEAVQALKQSVDAGRVPFASECGWYLSRVQLARDGPSGKARFLEFTKCWFQSHGTCVRGVPARSPERDQAKSKQHPPYSHVVPATAAGGRCTPPVQFIRHGTLGDEPSRH
jgi:hypothetical protein